MRHNRPTLISGSLSIDWLFETHLKHKREFRALTKAAILYGNEDCPDGVDLYGKRMPLVSDKPLATFDNNDESGILFQTIG